METASNVIPLRAQVTGKELRIVIPRRATPHSRIVGEKRFRIWNELEHRDQPWRRYKHKENAKNTAFLLTKGAEVGQVFDVYDARSGDWIASYKRGLHSVAVTEE